MKKNIHYLYIALLTVLSVAVFVALIKETELNIDIIIPILFWGALGIIAESFYIILPSGASTSVGMAVYLAALITTNPFVAVSVAIISFLFRMPEDNNERLYLFKYSLSTVLYNISVHVIIIGSAGHIYSMYVSPDASFSIIVIGSLVILTLIELMSILSIIVYFRTSENHVRIPLFRSFLGALPNTWAVGSLGLILAFFELNFNRAVVVIFFIPLLLARYSFKLYFDSQKTGQETIEALNATLHYRDAYTAGHTQRVEVYTLMLAKAMNYVGKDLERIKKAARLHDIGKIGVPDGILNKPGRLTDEEFQRIKDHSAMGAQILSNVDTLKKVTEIVRQHHERPDGKGYPDGLIGEAISLDASILSIADTYDAMTSKRPYRDEMSKEYAVSELRKYRGTQFRGDLVEVFIEALESLDAEELEFTEMISYEAHMKTVNEEVVYDS